MLGLAMALALGERAAGGEPLPTLAVVGESQCPAPSAVAGAIAELLPEARVTLGEGAITARLTDEGRNYRVAVAGRERRFGDPGRRCDERARAAAVFVALTIAPPSVSLPALPEAPPDESSPEAPRPIPKPSSSPATPAPVETTPTGTATSTPARAPALPPVAVPASRWRLAVALEAVGVLEGAPRTAPDNSLLTGGGALRLAVGATPFSVVVGAGGRGEVTMNVIGGTASLLRVPFDLDLRTALRRGSIELAAELGLAATLLFIGGQGFQQTESASRLELGVRIAGSLRRWFGERVAIAVGLETLVAPRPFELTVASGVVGTTPRIWLALSTGVVFRIH